MERLAQIVREGHGDGRPDPVEALEYAETRKRALDSAVRRGSLSHEGLNDEERRLVADVAAAASLVFEDLTLRLRR